MQFLQLLCTFRLLVFDCKKRISYNPTFGFRKLFHATHNSSRRGGARIEFYNYTSHTYTMEFEFHVKTQTTTKHHRNVENYSFSSSGNLSHMPFRFTWNPKSSYDLPYKTIPLSTNHESPRNSKLYISSNRQPYKKFSSLLRKLIKCALKHNFHSC